MAKVKERVARSPLDLKVFKKYPYESDWFFRQRLSVMSEHASDIGEILYLASKIDPKDGESWIKEWADLGEKLEKHAETALAGGHKVSARESFLHAWNYYQAAEYGCAPSHPRFHELWRKSMACMHKAGALFRPPIQPIEILFEGSKMPGYFWRPDDSDTKRPTLISVGGSESAGEQILLDTGPAAVERGYNYFTFEYPGHRGAVHTNYPGYIKRPDQQVPFKVAIDFLQTLPGVDERIALTGFSWGGYVTTKVAAYEKRLKAVIPNSPLLDWHEVTVSYFEQIVKRVPKFLLNKLIDWKISKNPVKKSLFKYAWWTLGDENMKPMDWYTMELYKEIRVSKEELRNITCPALGLIGENEGKVLVDQAKEFYEGISSKNKKLYTFTMEKDGTSDHVQIDNRTRGKQVMFDWLDDLFDYRYEPAPPSS